jgi:hypothetical protein
LKKSAAAKIKVLRRYTSIPSLVYLLTTRQITLLDPSSWDDKNDSQYLVLYREKKQLTRVLTLCFTEAAETYHHWRVFAGGSAGVCIRFKRDQLLDAIRKEVPIRAKRVEYLSLGRMRAATPRVDDLPFLKRSPYRPENEFRIIYESSLPCPATRDIPIPLSVIQRITLSPWLSPTLSSHVKRLLKSINGCANIEIVRSTLISNEEWRKHGCSAE